jgi:TolA-binding protein
MANQTQNSSEKHHHDAELAIRFMREKVMPNAGRIFWFLLAVVALILLATTYIQRTRTARSAALAELEYADSVEALASVAEDHAGTEIGAKALLRKARMQLQTDDSVGAAATYREYLDSYPDSGFRNASSMGLATALEVQGAWKEAYDLYVELAEKVQGVDGQSFLAGEAWVAAGRCAEGLGNAEDARLAYENAITHGTEAIAATARQALVRVE